MRRAGDIRDGEAMGWGGNYVQLRAYMVRDLGLSGRALLAFAIIHGFASKSGSCTSTLAYFAWWLGCSERSCTSTLRRLEAAGLISVDRGRDASGARRNAYRLTERGTRPPRREVADGAWDLEDDCLVVTGPMVSCLGLRGRDLVTYATLFERLQDGGECAVPLSALAAWSGSSAQTARRSARRLEALGLVEHRVEWAEHSVPRSVYRLGRVRAQVEATAAALPEEPPAREPEPVPADRFSELKPHVLTTRNFKYGHEAYHDLLAMGLTHEEVVGRLDAIRRGYMEGHPDTPERFRPQCHRLLESMRVEVEDERARAERAGRARWDDALTLVRAANLPGALGTEACRLLEESQRAVSRGDPGPEARLAAERRAWCELHRDEIWGERGRAAAGA